MITYMSKTGVYHEKQGIENQDFICGANNSRYSTICLADGVSACKYAKTGAETACKVSADILINHAERIFSADSREAVYIILKKVRNELEKLSKNSDIQEYSSTLACVLCDRANNKIFYLNLGDSLIMAGKKDVCRIISQPCDSRNGLADVTTAENAEILADSGIMDADGLESVILCSDGAYNLMYNRTRINSEIKSAITEKNFNSLKSILSEKENFDDCSFIALDLNKSQEDKNHELYKNTRNGKKKLYGQGGYNLSA